MATEKLTQKALEQHDKIHPRLQPSKGKTNFQSKEDRSSVQVRLRHLNRSESSKSLLNGFHEHNSLDGQGSEAPRPKAGLSVFRVIAAARAFKRLSQKKAAIPDKPKVLLENTYRLGPEPQQIFRADKVESAIQEIVIKFLRKFKYTPDGCKQMCLTISSEIKSKVKRMQFPRYKFVCNVIIMQSKGQGSEVCSRCIWTPSTDSFASYTFKNGQIICVANVHAVYFE